MGLKEFTITYQYSKDSFTAQQGIIAELEARPSLEEARAIILAGKGELKTGERIGYIKVRKTRYAN